MLGWAVVYPSWTAFVFLVLGCVLWFFPDSRKATFISSPALVAYSVVLCFIQYVCSVNYGGIDYNNTGLFFNASSDYAIATIGLIGYDYPASVIMLKMFFTMLFCVVLRQLRRENCFRGGRTVERGVRLSSLASSMDADVEAEPDVDPDGAEDLFIVKLGHKLSEWLGKYWLLAFYTLLLIMAIQEPYIYRLIYMVFFLYSAITLQFHYPFWRFTLKMFLIVVAVYSVIATLIVYIFSFHDVLISFKNATGISADWLTDLGFDPEINYQEGTASVLLLSRLIVPALLLVTVMLQIHIFHDQFMQFTEENQVVKSIAEDFEAVEEPPPEPTKNLLETFFNFIKSLLPSVNDVFYSAARMTTIHLYKIVYIAPVYIITREPTAFGFILLIVLDLGLFFNPEGKLSKLCLLMSQFWIGIIVLAKMLYQLYSIPKDLLMANCTMENETLINGTYMYIPLENADVLVGQQSSAAWLGLDKLRPDGTGYADSLPQYIGGYISVLIGFTALVLFKVHDHYRQKVSPTPAGVTFPSITLDNLDESLKKFLGYLVNHTFNRFGLEICFVTTTVVVSYRQDVIGAIYVLLLAALLLLNMYRRMYVRRVWFLYLIILALLLPAQYLCALGIPPTLCLAYPWISTLADNLRIWLYLPSYVYPPEVTLLFADSLQLLFVALQYRVFIAEAENGNEVVRVAGSNEEFDLKPPDRFKDMHDFTEEKRNFVDVIFATLFSYWFWLCLAMLFITGTQNINLYCFGYLLSCFYFFWHGLDFTTKSRRAIIRTWNIVLYYNFFVILMKTWLQILGCVFLDDLLVEASKTENSQSSVCYAPELFSIKCLNVQLQTDEEVCGVSKKEAGLMWDILCFVALLIQRRIFLSTYFLLIMCEERSQSALSSRGASLLNDISAKKVVKQQNNYEKEMVKIKKKLDRIRQRTLRLEGGASREDWTHFDVIRSGDGSFFEEGSDDETVTEADLDEDDQAEQASPMKLIMTTIDEGMEGSMEKKKRKSIDSTHASASENEDGEGSKAAEDGEEDALQGSGEGAEIQEESKPGAVQTTMDWIKEFCVVCITWTINRLNEISRDYRTVASQIDEEQVVQKRLFKEQMQDCVHEPDPQSSADAVVAVSDVQIDDYEEHWQEQLEQRSLLYRFFNAVYTAFMARTEFICYLAIIICHMSYGTLLSLPLPLVALTWGMLSVPRPAKTFWNVILTYVMVIVMIKYLFQFSFWPWTDTSIISWYDPRLLFGIEDTDVLSCVLYEEACEDPPVDSYYATYELLVLLAVFIHRSVLKRYGLWKNERELNEDMRQVKLASVSNPADLTNASMQEASSSQDSSNAEGEETGASPKKLTSGLSLRRWFRNITHGKLLTTSDYYAPMFLCDFVNFIISIFCYNSFGSNAGASVTDYLSSNTIPIDFLVLLLVQFLFIVIDRALYLQKAVFGKLIYTVCLIVLVHVYVGFILPALNGIPFNQNTVVQIFYFIKCLYFGFSAWQIKSGYPSGVLGNFLTTKYTYVNLVLYYGFILCPFLLELRCVMDWMWTASSMSLSTWFVMEDIFSNIFILKCFRSTEAQHPTKRATNKGRLMKYGFGGFVLTSLILVVWFPLVIFSFANTIYNPNPPVQCEMRVSIGGFQDLFFVRTQTGAISSVTPEQVEAFKAHMDKSASASAFLNIYEATDINTIMLNGESTAIWGITTPSKQDLIRQLNGTADISLTVSLQFTRQPQEGLTAGIISTQYFYNLTAGSTARNDLYKQISDGNGPQINFTAFLPRYLVLPASGLPEVAKDLHCNPCTDTDFGNNLLPYHGLALNLKKDEFAYWEVEERGNYTQQFIPQKDGDIHDYPHLFYVTFSERIAPDAVSLITGSGIIGLYIGLVFVVGQFIRTLTSGGSYVIMFNDLPNVDKIMKICKDLYFVRENGELDLEEELYAKLVYLYRSPPTMIEWTKKAT
ncbi:piezo-type mechanosensitive ion channel component 1-like [Watersipora subatra]|uniref:piezo-type mechanosensitive ion channel component 1-like n=1 Tax=Watersipora subatra TaxID=2589382 RepID=UPI00355C25E4